LAQVGQEVQITNTEEEGWWEGILDGKKGVFPNNFVGMLPATAAAVQPAKAKPAAPGGGKGMGFGDIFAGGGPKLKASGVQGRPKSQFSSNKAPARAPAQADTRELVKATFDYTAEQQDELGLTIGQFIRIIKKEEGGWWEGQIEGSDKRGWFPDNFVEPCTADEIARNKGGGKPAGARSPMAPSAYPPPTHTHTHN